MATLESSEVAPTQTENTGPAIQLFDDEKPWRERHDYLLNLGYKLRPRYAPDWKPSWKRVVPRDRDEDAIAMSFHGGIMDAQRMSDNTTVMMKVVTYDSLEFKITKLLSSEPLRNETRNHSVPLLDVLDDPLDDARRIMVLPLLRDSRSPPFASIGDCIEFVNQTLEGLCFLHEQGVAHRDCYVANIMMDARALYPKSWHPQEPVRARSGRIMTEIPQRKGVGGVRYYFIDFGVSSLSQDELTGIHGQKLAPELSNTNPYNPFRVDIWLLGSAFDYLIAEKFGNVDWIKPLIDSMTREDPSARPSVKECIEQFDAIQATITPSRRARRLHPAQPEWKLLEVIRDMRYLVSEGYWAFKPKHKPLPPFQPTKQRPDSPGSSEGGETNQQIAKPAEEVVPLSPESRATPSQPLDKTSAS
ncbi:hypothetical protein FRC02_001796 [Tulasnella sp. 418]|nr:hypothetical protein FRC02_001796 [Tulasnella sp. 418]